LWASKPVIVGPRLWADVLTTLMAPMTAVRSWGSTTAARKAERGATSMDCVQERRTMNMVAKGRLFGTGIRARKMAEGR